MKDNNKTCNVEGCENPIRNKRMGLCNKHYMRVYNNGTIGKKKFRARQHEVCTVDGCESPHSAKGYCAKHYTRYKKYGDPLHRKTKTSSWNMIEYNRKYYLEVTKKKRQEKKKAKEEEKQNDNN